jgi:response regulator RpfG family c-di-GMP phosphodiesterase
VKAGSVLEPLLPFVYRLLIFDNWSLETMKRRVLFIDDEPNILSSMKRMLRGLRKTTTMGFVEGGQEGLSAMEEEPYDLVVSDMRMPGMDGAEFLAAVRERWPHTMRVLLTGQADSDSLLRTVHVVHTFLLKPCEQDEIKATIERACALHSFLKESGEASSPQWGLDTAFSMPPIYQELQQELLADDCSFESLASCLQQDGWLCEKMALLSKGAAERDAGDVAIVAEVIGELGKDVLRTLVLSLHLFKQLLAANPSAEEAGYLVLSHGMQVAQDARRIAVENGADLGITAEAFIGGLLHDVGSLMVDGESGVPANHAGGLLLVMLGFPLGVIEIVAYLDEQDHNSSALFNGLNAVHLAHSQAN